MGCTNSSVPTPQGDHEVWGALIHTPQGGVH